MGKTPSRYTMKKTCILTGAFLLLLGLAPLGYGVWNLGAALLTGGGIASLLAPFLWSRIPKLGQKILAAFVLLGALVFAAVSALMLAGGLHGPPEDADLPLVVLGAKVYDQGPSPILERRLIAAGDYLRAHPTAFCIVSGGQGADESRSEAAVMAQYLIEVQGIDPGRILLEDKSTSTAENLRFSKALLGGETQIAIATNFFHQLRAGFLAEAEGLKAYSVSASSQLGLIPAYWVREVCGILALLVRG